MFGVNPGQLPPYVRGYDQAIVIAHAASASLPSQQPGIAKSLSLLLNRALGLRGAQSQALHRWAGNPFAIIEMETQQRGYGLGACG